MAINYTYPLTTTVVGGDLLVIADSSASNATKNITAEDFGAYIQATYGPGTNMYQANGSLTDNRVIDGAGFGLVFNNTSQHTIITSQYSVTSTNAVAITSTASNITLKPVSTGKVKIGNSFDGSALLIESDIQYKSTGVGEGKVATSDADGYMTWESITINDSNWDGTDLSIANGGTGQSTAQLAINALAGVGTDTHVLTLVAGDAVWSAVPSSTNIYNTNGTVINGRIAELAGDMTWQGSGSSEVHYTNMDALGVTDGGSIPIDSGTLFQLDSTTRGFLPPRMTSTQMEAIGSPVEGLIVHATDADRPQFNNGTSWRGFGDLFGLYAQTVQSATVTGTTETSIIGTGVGSLTIPANAFRVGDSFHGKIGGVISDTSNGDDITVRIKAGATVLATTGAFALDTTAAAGEGWEMELDFTIATLGAAGSICTNGNFAYTKTNDKKVSGYVFQDVEVLDTTISNTLDITVEWAQDGQNIYSANLVLYRTFVGS